MQFICCLFTFEMQHSGSTGWTFGREQKTKNFDWFLFLFPEKNKSVPWKKKNAVPFKDEVDRWTWGKVKKEKAMHTSVMNDRQSRW